VQHSKDATQHGSGKHTGFNYPSTYMLIKDWFMHPYHLHILKRLDYCFAAAATFETRQRNHQATPGSGPRHLQHDQESSCTGMRNDKVDTQTNKHSAFASSTTHTADDRHGGRRTREPMTSRARISSSDLDSLKGNAFIPSNHPCWFKSEEIFIRYPPRYHPGIIGVSQKYQMSIDHPNITRT
jgi:hypothetical protein